MKTAVIYESVTGNTKKLAQWIREELPDGELVYFGEPQEGIKADFYFIGSWTDKGMCAAKTADFLKSLQQSRIAYFGTAGFGGSEDYYESLFQRIKTYIDESNTVCGYFFCQGKMPLSVRERYVKMLEADPENVKMQNSIRNFDAALSHPDEDDRKKLKEWLRGVKAAGENIGEL